MAGMQETDRLTMKNGITYLLQDAKARAQLAELLAEVMEKYGADNPPPYPVTSVNGQTGDVDIPTVDLPVSVQDGGTGATSAATARANLAVPNMQTESYPALLPPDGSNNYIKIGKANSSYGLLPSQSGSKGSGHNNFGTSSWYWSNAYVDNYYGSWKGDTIPVDKGGTGATTAAAARTNLGAIAMPTVINLSTTSSSNSYSRTVTVSGSGVVVVYCGLISTATSDYGTYQAEIYHNGTKIMAEGCRTFETMAQIYGSSTSVPIAVSNGNTIKVSMTCTKNASVAKPVYLRFLCFGCTVS